MFARSCIGVRWRLDTRSNIIGKVLRDLSPFKIEEMADSISRLQDDRPSVGGKSDVEFTDSRGLKASSPSRG